MLQQSSELALDQLYPCLSPYTCQDDQNEKKVSGIQLYNKHLHRLVSLLTTLPILTSKYILRSGQVIESGLHGFWRDSWCRFAALSSNLPLECAKTARASVKKFMLRASASRATATVAGQTKQLHAAMTTDKCTHAKCARAATTHTFRSAPRSLETTEIGTGSP